MNILDIAVLLLFAVFLLGGWYRGFVHTVLSLGAYVLAFAFALTLRPLVTNAIKADEQLYTMALYYTEGAELVQDVELSKTPISALSAEQLSGVMENATLPVPMGQRISENIAREAFLEDGASTLGQYFNLTIVNVFINLFAVLALFTVVRLLLAFAIHLITYARNGFPVLHTADGLLGACFGLIRGFLAMYLIFLLVPIVLIILPKAGELIDASYFGGFFSHSNLLLRLIPGT